jgi:predicted ABC-type ATPase
MVKYINIRGCNGSGKTTLLRELVKAEPDPKTWTINVPDHKPVPVTWCAEERVMILGDYTPAATGTTAGLDRIKTQDAMKYAIKASSTCCGGSVMAVLFEGVIVSTIYGPWHEWSQQNGGMIWCYLDTPVDLCLKRIQERNGGKPIKDDLVMDKFHSIARTQEKARKDGEWVEVFHWEKARGQLTDLLDTIKIGRV